MSSFWEKLRSDFPITRKLIYLDHAACGPIPLPVRSKIQSYYDTHTREADFAWDRWMRERDAVRQKVAAFIGAEPEEITFTQSTSHGMNLAAELLAREGKVLTNELEFPSSTIPWVWRKAPLIFQKVEAAKVSLNKLRVLLAKNVKTILTSQVQYATGFRQDLEALGKMKGSRYLVVNATQGLGVLKMDVRRAKIDFLTANSYKWMMAGYGGGILFIRKKWLARFRPTSVGWRSMREPERMDNQRIDVRKDAARYEGGCPSFPTIFALGAAVDYFNSIGVEKIQNRILALTGYAMQRLEEEDFEVITPNAPEERAGIVVFKIKNALKIWKELLNRKICVSARGPGLRFSPHFYNTFEEIDTVIKKIKTLQKRGDF